MGLQKKDDEITLHLQCHLSGKPISPSDVVVCIQIIVGGDHRYITFQFDVLFSVELIDGSIFDFEVSICEVICQKDMATLIGNTILPQLTNGLEVVATMPLRIGIVRDEHGNIEC
jgi:hypothetical protein